MLSMHSLLPRREGVAVEFFPIEQTDALLGGVVHEVGDGSPPSWHPWRAWRSPRRGRATEISAGASERRLVENRGALVKQVRAHVLWAALAVAYASSTSACVHAWKRYSGRFALEGLTLSHVRPLDETRHSPSTRLVRPVRRGCRRRTPRSPPPWRCHASRAEKAERAESAAPACGCLARRTTRVENLRANVAARDAAVERDAILERGRERAGRGRARPCACDREEARGTTLRQNPRVGLFESHVLFRRIDQNVLTVCDLRFAPIIFPHFPACAPCVSKTLRRSETAHVLPSSAKLLIDY